jgi:PAS domain S-box-containing protein
MDLKRADTLAGGPGLGEPWPGRWSDGDPFVEALVSAGTAVWEWDVESDEIRGAGRAEQMLGYPPTTRAATQAEWDRFIHPDDRRIVDAAFDAHVLGGAARYDVEYRARTADGRWRWLQERGRVIERDPAGRPRRMVGTISDVTERREAQERQAHLGKRLEEIARNVPGMLFQMEQSHGLKRFTYASDRAVEVLGVTPQQLLDDVNAFESRRLLDDAAIASLERIDPAASAGPWVTEFPVHRGDGAVRWIRITSTSLLAGERVLWNGYLEDVTERRELEAMRQQVAEANAANRAKTEFFSRMSHELRTPLNAVLGFAQLLEIDAREPLGETQRQRVARIREAGGHLVEMIGDLLDFARIEAGQLPLDIGPVTLAPLVIECCDMLAPAAAARDITWDLPAAAATDAPQPVVLADRTRLRQVLLNLLSNAVKYNRPGGRVEVRAEAGVGQWRIAVADTGIGIAPESIGALFQPFNRLGHERSGIEGTGIGLAVSRGLAAMMSGTLEVRSTPGVGSVFTLVLPAAPREAAPGAPRPGS